MYDMHCHLDFSPEPDVLAKNLAACDVKCFSVGVSPHHYTRSRQLLSGASNVRTGLGLHPWWIKPDHVDEDFSLFETYAAQTNFIGEVGLDFSLEHDHTSRAQTDVFIRIARLCAKKGGKVLSVHAVRSAALVLDILKQEGTLDANRCIFHWFSGTSDELHEAVKLGCYFSVGKRMMQTKRGRAYTRCIPLKRLLLETDKPSKPNEVCEAKYLHKTLQCVMGAVGEVRSEDDQVIAHSLEKTSQELLRNRELGG